MRKEISIGNKLVGEGHDVFIIAEISANHNQDLDLARKTVEEACKTGVDAIKLQTYTADTITLDSKKDYFKIGSGTVWDGQYMHELYHTAYTPWEWHAELKNIADAHGLVCFSSPFDHSAVDFLEELDVPAYKIASFELVDIPLIKYTASKGKPMIMSTGIAEWEEIGYAIDACKSVGNDQIAILKCTSSYPAPMDEINLRIIPKIRQEYDVIVGLSDHTMGATVPIGATALGAKIIEKHFILDRGLGGPDSGFSMEPDEFRAMVRAVRDTSLALGDGVYSLSGKSRANRKFSRSLFLVEDVAQGETFTHRNVRSIRPSDGLLPVHLDEIIGKTASRDLERGEPLAWDMIAE